MHLVDRERRVGCMPGSARAHPFLVAPAERNRACHHRGGRGRQFGLLGQRITSLNRLTALLEPLGPGYLDALGGGLTTKTAQAVLSRYADPRKLLRTPAARLDQVVIESSRGRQGRPWPVSYAPPLGTPLCCMPVLILTSLNWQPTSRPRYGSSPQFRPRSTSWISASRVSTHRPIRTKSTSLCQASVLLWRQRSTPCSAIRSGFASLAAARAFTGLIPGINQSGIGQAPTRLTKAGDPGLRTALFMAADLARQIDPTLAAKYRRLVVERKLHHNSAICHLAAILATRILACLRSHTPYQIRTLEGQPITRQQGRASCAALRVQPHERRTHRRKAGQTKKEVAKRLVA